MGSRTLICLGRRTVQRDDDHHGGEGTEGHGHGKEGARVLEQGIHFASLRFSRWENGAGIPR